jgi:hypothetical protein
LSGSPTRASVHISRDQGRAPPPVLYVRRLGWGACLTPAALIRPSMWRVAGVHIGRTRGTCLDPCPLLYAGSRRFLGGWTRERGSVERDPSCPRAGSRGICHALLPVALRPSLLPDSSSLYPPFYVRGFPARDAQDSRRKFGARILGANFAQEFLAQILRKNSWRKLCARIPGANFAQEFPTQGG